MKKYFILLIIALLATDLTGQNPQDNLKKYWYYRYRLLNNFMKYSDGNEHGTNMPANVRGMHAEHKLNWGDGTITLGNLISVLATEYHLLKLENLPVDSVVRELYLTLNALNRLDFFAETQYTANNLPGLPSLNGFLIREDHRILPNPFKVNGLTPDDLSPEYYDHFNSGKVHSEFEVLHASPHIGDVMKGDMTQDQIWPIFVGLALVVKFVDVNANYDLKPFMDGQVFINAEAKAILTRIMDFVSDANDPDHYWDIINPVTGNCVYSSSPHCHLSNTYTPPCYSTSCGSTVKWAAFGAAEVACKILNNFSGLANTIWVPFTTPYTCTDYHGPYTKYVDYNLWQTYQVIPFGGEESKIQAIAAVGNSWYQEYIYLGLPLPFATHTNVTAYSLGTRAAVYHYEHFPLIRQLLHGGINLIQQSNYEIMLNEAPCEGPWFVDLFNSSPSVEWRSVNRLQKPESKSSGDIEFPGEYNGIDYMLYHNLFYIAMNSSLPKFRNIMDHVVTHNLPYTHSSGLIIGNQAFPAEITAFRSVKAIGTFAADTYATIAACELIDVNELEIVPGAEVTIDPTCFQCGGPWVKSGNNSLYGMGDLFDDGLGSGPEYGAEHQDYFQHSAFTDPEERVQHTVICYPNPAMDFTKVEITPMPDEAVPYELFDAAGRKVSEGIIKGPDNSIRLDHLDRGYYMLVVKTREQTSTFRVAKM